MSLEKEIRCDIGIVWGRVFAAASCRFKPETVLARDETIVIMGSAPAADVSKKGESSRA